MSDWNPELDVTLTDSEDEEGSDSGRKANLFVLDANLYVNPERFATALGIIREALISSLLVKEKDLIGVMFANTEKSPIPYEPNCLDNIVMPDNCAVFLPLSQSSTPIVEHYMRFLATSADNFGKDFGIKNRGGCGNFAKMLRLCLNLFEHCGYSLSRSTIVFLTDRDTPHPKQSQDYMAALLKANDLEGRMIMFDVMPMTENFDYDVFYKEFLTLVRDDDIEDFIPSDLEQLRKYYTDRKREGIHCRGHFNFMLSPSLELSAQYYSYFQQSCMPRKVRLLKKDNTIVDQKRVYVKRDPETNEVIEEGELTPTHKIPLGDMPIHITNEQLKSLKNLHSTGMMLLGFKSKSLLPPNIYYKPCNFMYPDDQTISGSKNLFRALWQRCRVRNKIAICLFMRRCNSKPYYVALVPVTGEGSNFSALFSGDGFKIVYLPVAKHLRKIDFSDWCKIEHKTAPEGVECFEKIISLLPREHDPNQIRDPKLERLQADLLALALNIKTKNDGLANFPDDSVLDKRIEHLIPNLEEIFGVDVEKANKRANNGSSEAKAAKIPKVTEEGLKNLEYVTNLIGKKALASCTVAQLRIILSEHYGEKVAKSMRKDALMETIYEKCGQKSI